MKQKHKNYIQLDQLKKIKKTKNGLKRNIKMQLNRNEKIPYVQVKQNNGKKKLKTLRLCCIIYTNAEAY